MLCMQREDKSSTIGAERWNHMRGDTACAHAAMAKELTIRIGSVGIQPEGPGLSQASPATAA